MADAADALSKYSKDDLLNLSRKLQKKFKKEEKKTAALTGKCKELLVENAQLKGNAAIPAVGVSGDFALDHAKAELRKAQEARAEVETKCKKKEQRVQALMAKNKEVMAENAEFKTQATAAAGSPAPAPVDDGVQQQLQAALEQAKQELGQAQAEAEKANKKGKALMIKCKEVMAENVELKTQAAAAAGATAPAPVDDGVQQQLQAALDQAKQELGQAQAATTAAVEEAKAFAGRIEVMAAAAEDGARLGADLATARAEAMGAAKATADAIQAQEALQARLLESEAQAGAMVAENAELKKEAAAAAAAPDPDPVPDPAAAPVVDVDDGVQQQLQAALVQVKQELGQAQAEVAAVTAAAEKANKKGKALMGKCKEVMAENAELKTQAAAAAASPVSDPAAAPEDDVDNGVQQQLQAALKQAKQELGQAQAEKAELHRSIQQQLQSELSSSQQAAEESAQVSAATASGATGEAAEEVEALRTTMGELKSKNAKILENMREVHDQRSIAEQAAKNAKWELDKLKQSSSEEKGRADAEQEAHKKTIADLTKRVIKAQKHLKKHMEAAETSKVELSTTRERLCTSTAKTTECEAKVARLQSLVVHGEAERRVFSGFERELEECRSELQATRHQLELERVDKDKVVSRRDMDLEMEREERTRERESSEGARVAERRTKNEELEKVHAKLMFATSRAKKAEGKAITLAQQAEALTEALASAEAELATSSALVRQWEEKDIKAQKQQQKDMMNMEATHHEKYQRLLKELKVYRERTSKLLNEQTSKLKDQSEAVARLEDEIATGKPQERRLFELAELQARRDQQITAGEVELGRLQDKQKQHDAEVKVLLEQKDFLEKEHKNLVSSRSRSDVNLDYLKNIMVRFVQFDRERKALIPVIAKILQFSEKDMDVINAAQGGGAWWQSVTSVFPGAAAPAPTPACTPESIPEGMASTFEPRPSSSGPNPGPPPE